MFAKDIDDRLTAHGPLSGPIPQQWEQFKTLVTESAKLTIGPKKAWPLQTLPKAGPGGTSQNAGRVGCHKRLKNVNQRHQGSLRPYQATHHAAPVS